MSSSAVSSFEESLASLPVTFERLQTSDVQTAISKQLEAPSVGMTLPYTGVSLHELSVSTSPGPGELAAARTGVTPALFGIADYGSIIVAEHGDGTEPTSLFPEKHIVVLAASDVVQTMTHAIDTLGPRIREGLSSAIIATGPSATADMGELVHGAHGPRDVHVIIIEDQ